jgi:uracil-DNA glycosylase
MRPALIGESEQYQFAKPIVIGEAPNRAAGADDTRPVQGRAARVLCELAGWEPADGATLQKKFFAINVLGEWPGSAGKGSAWPVERARKNAATLCLTLNGRRAAVLLGKRVAQAFGVDAEYGEWREADDAVPIRHVVVPHPSGINRALNDPELRKRTGEVLREAVKR